MKKLIAGSVVIEVILGFAISMVGLVAILQLTNRSIGNSGEASRNSMASRYADEGIDWVKGQEIVLGWSEFVGKSLTDPAFNMYCLNTPAWTAGDCGAGTTIGATEFTRNLKMSNSVVGGKTIVSALVTVTWQEAGRTDSVIRNYQFVAN